MIEPLERRLLHYLPGDATFDGRVDNVDFVILSMNFNHTTPSGPASADFNSDGVVNTLDFNALATNYGKTE